MGGQVRVGWAGAPLDEHTVLQEYLCVSPVSLLSCSILSPPPTHTHPTPPPPLCLCCVQGARHVSKDVAGKGIANPTAVLLSASMMLRHLQLHSFSDRCGGAGGGAGMMLMCCEGWAGSWGGGGTLQLHSLGDSLECKNQGRGFVGGGWVIADSARLFLARTNATAAVAGSPAGAAAAGWRLLSSTPTSQTTSQC